MCASVCVKYLFVFFSANDNQCQCPGRREATSWDPYAADTWSSKTHIKPGYQNLLEILVLQLLENLSKSLNSLWFVWTKLLSASNYIGYPLVLPVTEQCARRIVMYGVDC